MVIHTEEVDKEGGVVVGGGDVEGGDGEACDLVFYYCVCVCVIEWEYR
jgi:hypothetical protein